MPKVGRPSEYTDQLAEQICELVCSGKSRREAAATLNLSESTVRLWQKQHEAFSAQYARAEAERAEWFFERGNEIAMSITTPDEAQVARVQLDWLKWSASKLAPKKYSEKQNIAVEGEFTLKTVVVAPDPKKAEKKPEPKPEF